ncbi:uncharacterized protein LOC116286511 isoform X2 [Actinia tenebrosa]|uniref:Uncharacterized protein LOC116286511 isoform X2 n=1 Tax=Actinia tenebrosa TaxID=6105 RepID=A0A6P8H903_ACTTE|nr:uncharacterized protein LOC116286511 isoform X2 [Actinia tenebrosa]
MWKKMLYVYKLKEAKKKRIATLRPLLTDGIVPDPAPKGEEDDDTDSGISSHGTASNGNGSIPSPDLSKTELARRLSNASLRDPVHLKAKVLWDFEPRLQNTELQVSKGEIVHLLYRDSDKVLAMNSLGKRGFIPFNFCSLPHKKIDANLSRESVCMPSNPARKQRKQSCENASFKEFLDDMDLLNKKSFTRKHALSSKSHNDFKRLQTKSFSEEGIFGTQSSSSDSEDESFYRRKTSGIPDHQHMIFWNRKALERFRQQKKMNVSHFRKCNDMYMLVLYNFFAQDENDINVYKGDIVRVLNRDDRDWWWVATRSGCEGFVPSSYLTRRSVVPSSGPSTSCSVESSSSTSDASSTQAVRFQDPLCTFHRYEKEEWETDSEVSVRNTGRSLVGIDEHKSIDHSSSSRWSTWC